MMKILITGCDGYIGWPTFLKLCFSNKRLNILGIDNFSRRKWVNEINSESQNSYIFNETKIKRIEQI